MINYSLQCDRDHHFDSWFQSADAFDKLLKAGHVTCAVCGTESVKKAIMAPRVSTSEREVRPLSAPKTPAEQALSALKEHIEKNADYVGTDFASEARAIHDGDAPERPIWGEAKLEDAKKLVEDGVPVAPLPIRPGRKSN